MKPKYRSELLEAAAKIEGDLPPDKLLAAIKTDHKALWERIREDLATEAALSAIRTWLLKRALASEDQIPLLPGYEGPNVIRIGNRRVPVAMVSIAELAHDIERSKHQIEGNVRASKRAKAELKAKQTLFAQVSEFATDQSMIVMDAMTRRIEETRARELARDAAKKRRQRRRLTKAKAAGAGSRQ